MVQDELKNCGEVDQRYCRSPSAAKKREIKAIQKIKSQSKQSCTEDMLGPTIEHEKHSSFFNLRNQMSQRKARNKRPTA